MGGLVGVKLPYHLTQVVTELFDIGREQAEWMIELCAEVEDRDPFSSGSVAEVAVAVGDLGGM